MTDSMTLSDFAERVHGMIWADGWHDLDEIADRLDEELDDLEVLRSVGSDADRLVREHGGLDAVRERLERVDASCDREALLALADSLDVSANLNTYPLGRGGGASKLDKELAEMEREVAGRIRKACGVDDA